ncbi:MAG: hypothetical protein IBX56_07875 [Methylomicrobium sp.]|nr:hypothetical protein [Methylomicrobium sp.]
MSKLTLTAFNGTDTPHILQLTIAGDLIDHSVITRVQLSIKGTIVGDSDDFPAAWDLTNTDKLIVKLGLCDLSTGQRSSARLITYDAAHPNGFGWDTNIDLRVL